MLNTIINRRLVSANIPATFKPVAVFRDDVKRPDGMTFIPCKCGMPHLCNSYIYSTKAKIERAAVIAVLKKASIYKALQEKKLSVHYRRRNSRSMVRRGNPVH